MEIECNKIKQDTDKSHYMRQRKTTVFFTSSSVQVWGELCSESPIMFIRFYQALMLFTILTQKEVEEK